MSLLELGSLKVASLSQAIKTANRVRHRVEEDVASQLHFAIGVEYHLVGLVREAFQQVAGRISVHPHQRLVMLELEDEPVPVLVLHGIPRHGEEWTPQLLWLVADAVGLGAMDLEEFYGLGPVVPDRLVLAPRPHAVDGDSHHKTNLASHEIWAT